MPQDVLHSCNYYSPLALLIVHSAFHTEVTRLKSCRTDIGQVHYNGSRKMKKNLNVI